MSTSNYTPMYGLCHSKYTSDSQVSNAKFIMPNSHIYSNPYNYYLADNVNPTTLENVVRVLDYQDADSYRYQDSIGQQRDSDIIEHYNCGYPKPWKPTPNEGGEIIYREEGRQKFIPGVN